MLGWTPESIKQWVKWMQFLDRWGYITACLSFLLVGMLVFGYSWYAYVQSVEKAFLPATIALLNDLLFVIILLELFRTVLGFLQSDRIRLEPFLHVGIIASVRRILPRQYPRRSLPSLPDGYGVACHGHSCADDCLISFEKD
jgi:hypothetical protein